MTREISLSRGRVALVDDDMYDFLMQWKWHAHQRHDGKFDARTQVNRKQICMHRLIINTPLGMQTDHIDRNTLNNQRDNLRPCTNGQNSANRAKSRGAQSQFKGIFLAGKRWRAVISIGRKHIHLGHFANEIDAAKAYDQAARERFGDFAHCNFPD